LHLCQGFRIETRLPGSGAFDPDGEDGPLPPQPLPQISLNTPPPTMSCAINKRYWATESGLYDPTGEAWKGPRMNVDIIFPSQNWYGGVRNDLMSYTKTMPGAKEVRGTIWGAHHNNQDADKRLHSMQIAVNSLDITNDFDSVSDPEGDSIVNLAVPKGLPYTDAYSMRQVTIDDYHDAVKGGIENATVAIPQKQINFRQIGLKGVLTDYINPVKGFESMSIVLDQDGSYIDWSFSTRPKQLPNQESVYSKIGSVLNMNTLR